MDYKKRKKKLDCGKQGSQPTDQEKTEKDNVTIQGTVD